MLSLKRVKKDRERNLSKTSNLKTLYQNGYLEGVKNTVKNLFTLDIISIEKISEVTKLSIEEIQKLTEQD